MSNVQSYKAIPTVPIPADYQTHVGPFLAKMYEQHGPIFRSTSFGNEIVFLVGPEANRFVLVSNRQKFSNYEGWSKIFGVMDMFGKGLLVMDGKEHDEHRRMMNPAFTISYMNNYLPLMNRIIRERTATWLEQGTVDIYDEARKITFDVAAEALAGLTDGAERDQFRDLFLRILMTPSIATSEEDFRYKLGLVHSELNALLMPKIEERRLHPTNDLFGLLVQARDDQGNAMSNEQLIAHVNILLVAGHETSTSLSAWLLYLLNQHLDYTKRVMDEQNMLLASDAEPTLEAIKQMKVLDNALSEAERLYPPVANGPRGVLEAVDFNGYHLPKGTPVLYSIAGSHMIPSIFAHPETFDPDRFALPREEHKKTPYALVGFGGGPRICIGINFAQIEIKAMISHILRTYQLDLIPGQDIVQFYAVTGMPINGIGMRVTRKA